MLIVAPTPGYDSLVSLVVAEVYHDSMGNTAWATELSQSVKEAALRRATQYVLTKCRLVDDATYPVVHGNVVAAVSELALRALSGPLYEDVQEAAVIEETVGPLTTKYLPGKSVRRFAFIDDLLSGLTLSGLSTQIPIYRS